jgi:hypothetical protein
MKNLFAIIVVSVLLGAYLTAVWSAPAPERAAHGWYLVKVYTTDGESLLTGKTSDRVSFLERTVQWRDDSGKLRIVSGGIVILEEQ